MIAVAEPPATKPRPEERIEKLLRTVSASRLGCWHGCRLKFYFRYVLQIPKPPTPARHSGSVSHAVLQAWNLARWRREPFQTERFKTLYETQWTALQEGQKMKWAGKEQKERSSMWRALEIYFLQTPIKNDERPEAVEVSVDADLSRHGLPTLVGIIDLVRAGGKIVDFKTTGKTPDAAQVAHQNEIQLSCYGVVYRDATGKPEGGFELHHLVKTKKPKLVVTPLPPMKESQRTRLFRSIDSYVGGLRRQDFVPSPGFHCAGCEFFNECRLW
jgi:RecB family exonuclease